MCILNCDTLLTRCTVVESRAVDPKCLAQLRRNAQEGPEWKGWLPCSKPGEIMRNPTLAQTFREVAKYGKAGYYTGRIAEELVKVVQDLGGFISLDDLKNHMDKGVKRSIPSS